MGTGRHGKAASEWLGGGCRVGLENEVEEKHLEFSLSLFSSPRTCHTAEWKVAEQLAALGSDWPWSSAGKVASPSFPGLQSVSSGLAGRLRAFPTS